MDSMQKPFDPTRFNFTKVKAEEILFLFRRSDRDQHAGPPSNPRGISISMETSSQRLDGDCDDERILTIGDSASKRGCETNGVEQKNHESSAENGMNNGGGTHFAASQGSDMDACGTDEV